MSRKLDIKKNKEAIIRQQKRYADWVKNAPLCKCGCGQQVSVSKKVLHFRIGKYDYSDYLIGHRTKNKRFIKINEEILIGTLLGDSYLGFGNKKSKSPRLSFTHSVKQKEYVIWKVEKLFPMQFTFGKEYETSFGGKVFSTTSRSYPDLLKYRELFYPNGKKIVNNDILNLLTKKSLAVWFCDDGSNDNRVCEYPFLWTCSFSLRENLLISEFLKNKFNVESEVKLSSRKHLYIQLDKSFVKLIKRYVPDCMRYKIEN